MMLNLSIDVETAKVGILPFERKTTRCLISLLRTTGTFLLSSLKNTSFVHEVSFQFELTGSSACQ